LGNGQFLFWAIAHTCAQKSLSSCVFAQIVLLRWPEHVLLVFIEVLSFFSLVVLVFVQLYDALLLFIMLGGGCCRFANADFCGSGHPHWCCHLVFYCCCLVANHLIIVLVILLFVFVQLQVRT
jgi:hypothetical protein